jgi:hypothetical protein
MEADRTSSGVAMGKLVKAEARLGGEESVRLVGVRLMPDNNRIDRFVVHSVSGRTNGRRCTGTIQQAANSRL